jgi:hypothetical protein
LITTDLRKIYAFNRAAEEISGFAANETVGRSIFSVFGERRSGPPIKNASAVYKP